MPAFRQIPRLAAGALLLFAWTGPASAWHEPDPADRFAVDARSNVPPMLAPGRQAEWSRSAPWTAFLSGHPGWVARWDERQAIVARAEGPARAIPGFRSIDRSTVEPAARAALAGAPELFGAGGELEFIRAVSFRDRWWAHFRQAKNGVPVFNGRVSLLMTADGRMLQIDSRGCRDLPLTTTPAIGADAAEQAGRVGLPDDATPEGRPELVILPLERVGGVTPRLTWQMTFRTLDPPGQWITFVDAADGRLLWRFNNVRYGSVEGVVTGDVEPETETGQYIEMSLPYVIVSIMSGNTALAAAVADSAGRFQVEAAEVAGRILRAPLTGLYGFVQDASNNFQIPVATAPVPDGGPVSANLRFGDATSTASGRDAYRHAMETRAWIRTIQPDFDVLNYGMPIRVEVDGACNAFWDGNGLNFFREGGGCTNSARLATIVMHEYGHAITDLQYRPFYPSAAMHEGWSDYTACSLTGQPVVGPGWRPALPNSYVRRIDEDRVQPRDLTGEPHNDGLVIASTLWDVRTRLGAGLTDSLWHFARYGYADNYDDYFLDVLRTDDDNGSIYDGTPHFDVLVDEFRRHGIGDFSIRASHVAWSDTEDTLRAFPIRATFLSLFALQPGSATIHLTVTGPEPVGPVARPMMATGGVREFEYFVDRQPPGTTVSYWFTVADTTGQTLTWPPAGQGAPFVFHVGPDGEGPRVAHELLPDQPLDLSSLMFRARVTDNLDRGIGPVRIRLGIDGARDDTGQVVVPDAPGLYRPVVSLPPGLPAGTLIEYRLSADDSATVPNRSWKPESGWHALHLARGFGRDFEADDGGLIGDGDWSRGLDPGGDAWSGAHDWDTNPSGNYSDEKTSILELPPVDLTGWSAVTLTFHHRYDTEYAYDGGRVEASADTGRSWVPVTPDGGYPFPRVVVFDGPGFTGRQADWSTVECDLSAWAGRPQLRLRFRFASDQLVNGPGWTIDDVQVVERQVAARPLDLEAVDGKDGRVPLRWNPPSGPGGPPPASLTGYHVYRRTLGDGREPVRITPLPLTARTTSDVTVANGVVYEYFVSALYSGGESPMAGPVVARPWRADMTLSGAPVEATIDSAGATTRELTIENGGSGPLTVRAWASRPDQSIDDVRIRFALTGSFAAAGGRLSAAPAAAPDRGPTRASDRGRLIEWLRAAPRPKAGSLHRSLLEPAEAPPSAEWDTLFVDSAAPGGPVPDLSAVAIQQTDDRLWFRVMVGQPWGRPLTDFNLLASLTTEGGSAGGYEFLLLTGPLPLALFGEPAILVEASTFAVVGVPHWLLLPIGGTAAEIGIDKSLLGRPEALTLELNALTADAESLIDAMPDPADIAWLAFTPNRFVVPAGQQATLRVTLDSGPVSTGDWSAVIRMDTSDPARPVEAVPITLHVSNRTPVVLGDFLATMTGDGLELKWRTAEETENVGFEVYRRPAGEPDAAERPLNDDLIPATIDGRYRFVDWSARPGFEYDYRLAAIGRSGERTWHGPFRVRVADPARPAALWLGPPTPNPSDGTAIIGYALPEPGPLRLAIFDLAGRRVRTIVDRSLHEAGWFRASWNGSDDAGRPVGAGVYFYRLTSAAGSRTGKLLRSR